MPICYLGLGSNLNIPHRQLKQALRHLRALPRSCIKAQSHIYHSKPLGPRAQPDYLNMVIALRTTLTPQQLLSYCKKIEKKQLRIHKKKWGSRTIDIDILLFGNRTLNLAHLKIPHLHLLARDFALIPLTELAPQLRLPDGSPISDYLSQGIYTIVTRLNF